MYSPYDFKTVEEWEGGKFRGTIVFTGIDGELRGRLERRCEHGTVYSTAHPDYLYTGGCPIYIWIRGRNRQQDNVPLLFEDETGFDNAVAALNAVRDKLIAEHETKKEDTKVESITVDGWTVSLLKPVTLAAIIKAGNVGCGEFRGEFMAFCGAMYNGAGKVAPDPFTPIEPHEANVRSILAHPKWRDFLVQHGFIEVKKVEPEFKVGKGDCFTVDGKTYVLASVSDNPPTVSPVSIRGGIIGNRYGGPYRVKDTCHLTLDEFKDILAPTDNWQTIYATKCRIKEVVTEKA